MPLPGASRIGRNRLDRLIERCLAPDPRSRPQSMAGVANTLRRELAYFSSRNRRRYQTAATLFVACAGLAGLAGSQALVHNRTLPDRERAAGLAAYQAGDFGAALTHLAAADERAPRAHLKAVMAFCKQQLDDGAGALTLYEQALSEGDETAAVYNNLGSLRLSTNDLEAAEDCFTRAVKLDPSFSIAHLNRAAVRIKQAQRCGCRLKIRDYLETAASDLESAKRLGLVDAELAKSQAWVAQAQAENDLALAAMALTTSLSKDLYVYGSFSLSRIQHVRVGPGSDKIVAGEPTHDTGDQSANVGGPNAELVKHAVGAKSDTGETHLEATASPRIVPINADL